MTQDKVLSIMDVAERLGCKPGHVHNLIRRRALDAFKLSPGAWAVPVESLERYQAVMASTVDTVQAADILGLTRPQVWRYIIGGTFKNAQRIGGRWRIPRTELDGVTVGRPGPGGGEPESKVRTAKLMWASGKYSQHEIAERLNVDVSTVNLWVRGKRRANG